MTLKPEFRFMNNFDYLCPTYLGRSPFRMGFTSGVRYARWRHTRIWMMALMAGMTVHLAFADGTSPLGSASTRLTSWQARCEEVASIDFSGVLDAPTQIGAAVPVLAKGRMPSYCRIRGYVLPQVGFELWLPMNGWNGKFLEIGCGGDCGAANLTAVECSGPVQKGYACIASDGGHIGGGGLWAYNNLQAQVDFAYRAAHVTAVAGKAITEKLYSRPPKYSYFSGCSTGGRLALVEAQRFPWDFNGIISGAPWINDSDSAMNFVWANRSLMGKNGKPLLSRMDLEIVHEAVLKKCDLDDGVKDGVVGSPDLCRFDPSELVCSESRGAGCLTQEQATAIRKVYEGPVNSKGEKLYVGGAAPGSEMGWILGYIPTDNRLSVSEQWAQEYFRYMVMPAAGSSWELSDYDFDRDPKRFAGGTQESLLSAANPDLRKFQATGGKLLIYQGWNDQSDLPSMTIDYYNAVQRSMGGRTATQDFTRLFLIPGMLHCTAGDGAFAVDYLSYLEKWVEQDLPPDKLIGAHVSEQYLFEHPGSFEPFGKSVFTGALALTFPLDPAIPVSFTRPIYAYPVRAQYKGKGNPNDESNFGPIER